MNISAMKPLQSADLRPKADKIGLLVAQKSLEAARQNQQSETVRPERPSRFNHPYLGHNVDIYV